MTLLAYRLEEEYVEVVTDTLTVADDGAVIDHAPKVRYAPHLEVLVAGTGLEFVLKMVGDHVAGIGSGSIDDVIPAAAVAARAAAQMCAEAGHASPTVLYLFGWSPCRRRYVGSLMLGGDKEPWEREWQPIDALLENPAYRGDGAGGSCRIWPHALQESFNVADETPSSVLGWVDLAEKLRVRMIDTPPEQRVIFGGQLIYSRLEAGGITQRRIHTFDDDGDDFARLLAGSANRRGAPHRWTGVGRNDPCPCKSGKKWKQCHDPRAAR